MQLKHIINSFEFFYPTKYAEEWDNVGLLIGSRNKQVDRIMCALEITNAVIDEAIEKDVDVIISHHPIIFKAITSLNFDEPQNLKIAKLIKHDIAVYCAHTNVDVYINGMSDWIAQVLGVRVYSSLKITHQEFLKKVEMEVKQHNLYEVLNILEHIGAGKSKENIQKVNIIPFVEFKKSKTNKENKADTLLLTCHLSDEQVINLKKELAKFKYDREMDKQFFISNQISKSRDYGIGRVGKIKTHTLEGLAEKIKRTFDLDHVRITGNRETIIRTVAIVGGSGADFIKEAKSKNVDVLITGDIGFHQAQEAVDNGMCLIDASHYMEIIFNDVMQQMLDVMFDIDVISSEIDVNPFEVI